jgi:hypothetical protein
MFSPPIKGKTTLGREHDEPQMSIFTTEFLYEIVNFRPLGMSAILNDEMR